MREKGDGCKNKKIIFMGTPEISVFALQALIDKGFNVIGIVSQPDKPIGRKQEIIFSPVKEFALKHNIKIFQPEKVGTIKDELTSLSPFAFVTCAFGQFIPDSILSIPEFGCINVHASLLPKYRGGAPIHWAIINGEKETGVCLMKTVKKMDAGDVYSFRKVQIDENETTTSLFKKMNQLVYQIISEDLDDVLSGKILGKSQDESLVTFGYNITKENEKIEFNNLAKNIKNLINGLSDKPGAYCFLNDKKIKLFKPKLTNQKSQNTPGTIISISVNGLEIATNDFNLLVDDIQIEGKKRQSIKEILNGNNILKVNQILK